MKAKCSMNDLISRSALLERLAFKRMGSMQRNTYPGLESAIAQVKKAPAVDAVEVVRCENCVHQQKEWHSDKRMKEGGFFMYSCELNQDPFVAHVVDGNPGEFCSEGERRADDGN